MTRRATRLKVDQSVDRDVVGNELRDVAPEIRPAYGRDVANVARSRAVPPIERRRLEASVHERVEPFGNAARTPPDVRCRDLTLERTNGLDIRSGEPVAAFVPIDRGVRMLPHEVEEATSMLCQRRKARGIRRLGFERIHHEVSHACT